MRQRCPATRTRVRQRDRVRGVAAEVGELAGAVVAADQQVMLPGVGVVLGQQRDPGPGVQAVAVAAGPGGVLLPGPRGQHRRAARRRGSGPASVGTRRLADDRQHVAEPVAADGRAQGRVGAVDLVAGDPRRRDLGRDRAADHRLGQRGFGREPRLSSGIPASSQRSGSSVHDLGRYRARSISACPRGAA